MKLHFLVLLVLLLTSCVEKNDPAPSNNTPKDNQNIISVKSSLYPHSLGFKKGSHKDYFKANSKNCTVCHGVNLGGGLAKTACSSCHGDRLKVGDSFVYDPVKSVCADAGKNCDLSSSMPIYPHKEIDGYLKNHGKFFKESKFSCTICHGEKLDGGAAKVNCSSCHGVTPGTDTIPNPDPKFYVQPHTGAFKHTWEHGKWYRAELPEPDPYGDDDYAEDTKVSCMKCHGDDLEGGSSKKSCKSCHKAYPHDDEFKKTYKHGQDFLKDRSECIGCHEMNSGSDYFQSKHESRKRKSCNTVGCHSYPHPPKWATDNKREKRDDDEKEYKKRKREKKRSHSLYFAGNNNTVNSDFKRSCSKCHKEGSDFQKRNPEKFVSCDKCHVSLPHVSGWETVHKMRGEGVVSESDKHAGDCRKCHITDAASTKVPDEKRTNCLNCHKLKDGTVQTLHRHKTGWKWDPPLEGFEDSNPD